MPLTLTTAEFIAWLGERAKSIREEEHDGDMVEFTNKGFAAAYELIADELESGRIVIRDEREDGK